MLLHMELLNISQAAALLDVHRTTVRRWIDEHKIAPVVQHGYAILLNRSDVERIKRERDAEHAAESKKSAPSEGSGEGESSERNQHG